MSNPVVSVIIPYHKKKEFFLKTINSVINQSYKKFEIIIIYDDHDLTELNFIKKIKRKYKKIKLIINKKILGPGLSRNKGIFFSRGEYIAFCDADDIWNKDKLKNQIKFMKSNNLNFSHTNYFVINKFGKKIGSFKVKKKIEYIDLLKSCDIGLSTVILKKKILKKTKLFSKLKTKEDFNLWLNLIKNEKYLIGINLYLASWRKLEISLSSSISQRLIDAFRLYYNYEKFNFFKSFFYVIRLSYFAYLKKTNIYK